MTCQQLSVEVLTGDSFAPFGEVLEPKARVPEFRGDGGTEGWLAEFQIEDRVEISTSRVPFQGLRFTKLERHLYVSQCFVPLRGSPSVLAVAPPTSLHVDSGPRPEDVRAFLIDGTQGVVVRVGVWHSMTRYPLSGEDAVFVVVTERATRLDFATAAKDKLSPQRTDVVDFAGRGIEFEFVLGASPAR